MKSLLNKQNNQKIDNLKSSTQYDTFNHLPPELLNTIEENPNQLIVILNEQSHVIFVSHSVHTILGYTKSEFCRLSLSDIVKESSLNFFTSYLDHKNLGKSYNERVQLIHKDQSISWYKCYLERGQVKDNHYFVAFFQSAQYERSLEHNISHLEKLSIAGGLAATIVHEIRNPLTSIKGFVQLMEAGIEGKQEYYDIMIEEIEKMENMATQLLETSKPTTNSQSYHQLNEMIEKCVTLLSAIAKEKNITLKTKLIKDAKVFCDYSQIRQVIINLVKNAIEAIDCNGTIIIQTGTHNDLLFIDIIDDGPGIPEDVLKNITRPFFTTKKEGTGLGLMVSSQLMEENNGKLIIKSLPMKGSKFRMAFPIKDQK